jgi:hypothetical protein
MAANHRGRRICSTGLILSSASLTPADAQATSNSIAIEIDDNQRDVIRLCAGAKDLPSADWSVFL